MKYLRVLYCYLVMKIVRPYIFREYYAWGKVYNIFVGSYKRDWLWKDFTPVWMRGKFHNYNMYLDLTTWSDRSTYFLGRWYDLECQLLMKDYLRNGDNVLDIGGNKGMFSLLCSNIVGDNGNIDAFEPNPEPRRVFEKHLHENNIKNVILHGFGLSDKNDTLILNVPKVNCGEGTFGASNYKTGDYYQTECLVKIGDEVFQDRFLDFIKIDVEGFEQFVLQGLVETITRSKPMILTEVVALHLVNANSSVENIANFFETLGYQGYKMELAKRSLTHHLKLVKVTEFKDLPNCDIVWIHNEDQRQLSFVNENN